MALYERRSPVAISSGPTLLKLYRNPREAVVWVVEGSIKPLNYRLPRLLTELPATETVAAIDYRQI